MKSMTFRSLKMASLDAACTTSYCKCSSTMATVFDIFDVDNIVNLDI